MKCCPSNYENKAGSRAALQAGPRSMDGDGNMMGKAGILAGKEQLVRHRQQREPMLSSSHLKVRTVSWFLCLVF